MLRRPISPNCIRSSIGAAYHRISSARSVISTSRQADDNGSPISTVIFFAPSVSLACVVHNAETGIHGLMKATLDTDGMSALTSAHLTEIRYLCDSHVRHLFSKKPSTES